MHKRIRSLSLLVAALAVGVSAENDVNDNLQQLAGSAAKAYIKPIISSLGANLNQGWFNQSPRPIKIGVDLAASFYLVGTAYASGAENFETSTSIYIDRELANTLAATLVEPRMRELGQNPQDTAAARLVRAGIVQELHNKTLNVHVAGPTIIGSDDEHVTYTFGSDNPALATELQGKSAELPVTGLDLSGFVGMPLPVAQITVGTFYGTMATIRALPEIEGIHFWGIGINHNPGVWRENGNFLPLGINSSVTFAYSSLGYGDYIDFSAWNLGLMASRRLGFRFLNITPYAGVGMERSTLSVSYATPYSDVDGNPIKVSIEESGENLFRLTVGTGIRLGILNFDAGYTLAKYSSANFGMHLAF